MSYLRVNVTCMYVPHVVLHCSFWLEVRQLKDLQTSRSVERFALEIGVLENRPKPHQLRNHDAVPYGTDHGILPLKQRANHVGPNRQGKYSRPPFVPIRFERFFY
ncbi:hypothetical protein LINPERPRIM_LOCUS36171 [Linum perenne]